MLGIAGEAGTGRTGWDRGTRGSTRREQASRIVENRTGNVPPVPVSTSRNETTFSR